MAASATKEYVILKSWNGLNSESILNTSLSTAVILVNSVVTIQ